MTFGNNLDNELTREPTLVLNQYLVVPSIFKLLEYKFFTLNYLYYLNQAMHKPVLLYNGGQISLSVQRLLW